MIFFPFLSTEFYELLSEGALTLFCGRTGTVMSVCADSRLVFAKISLICSLSTNLAILWFDVTVDFFLGATDVGEP